MILDYFLAQSPYPKHEESEEQKVIDTNLSTHILLMIQLDPDFHTHQTFSWILIIQDCPM